MARLTVERIENAFLPAREITDPARFAGPAPQIEQSYLALVSEGANIAIVGNRGIGKSSLARQRRSLLLPRQTSRPYLRTLSPRSRRRRWRRTAFSSSSTSSTRSPVQTFRCGVRQ